MSLTKAQLDSAKNVACEKCGSHFLKQAFVIKHISGLMMEDGRDTFVPVPVFTCNSCGHLNEVFAKELGLSTAPLIIEK